MRCRIKCILSGQLKKKEYIFVKLYKTSAYFVENVVNIIYNNIYVYMKMECYSDE